MTPLKIEILETRICCDVRYTECFFFLTEALLHVVHCNKPFRIPFSTYYGTALNFYLTQSL